MQNKLFMRRNQGGNSELLDFTNFTDEVSAVIPLKPIASLDTISLHITLLMHETFRTENV